MLREVATLAFEDRLASALMDLPEKIVPGPKATMRCCIYKERAIIGSRIKLAMGGNAANPNVVEVLASPATSAPSRIHRERRLPRLPRQPLHARLPPRAISIVNHRAQIDHDLCIGCGKCLAACPFSADHQDQRPCERSCKLGASRWARTERQKSIMKNALTAAAASTSAPSARSWTNPFSWTPSVS